MSNDTITPSMICLMLAGIIGIIAVTAMVVVNQHPVDSTIIFAAVVLAAATFIGWKYRYSGYRLM